MTIQRYDIVITKWMGVEVMNAKEYTALIKVFEL